MSEEHKTSHNDRNNAEAKKKKCPYCLSEVTVGAHRCFHCLIDISSRVPDHGGTCPLCRESIDPDASRCKWCKSWIIWPDFLRLGEDSSITFAGWARESLEPPSLQSRAMPEDPIFTEPWFQGNQLPPLIPSPPVWHCQYLDDWSTFNSRSRTLWVYQHCEDLVNGGTRRRPSHARRVTQREYDRWKADNT